MNGAAGASQPDEQHLFCGDHAHLIHLTCPSYLIAVVFRQIEVIAPDAVNRSRGVACERANRHDRAASAQVTQQKSNTESRGQFGTLNHRLQRAQRLHGIEEQSIHRREWNDHLVAAWRRVEVTRHPITAHRDKP